MSGKPRPLTCCDDACAAANGCTVGGRQCRQCGLWFCPVDELDANGLCDRCAAENEDAEA